MEMNDNFDDILRRRWEERQFPVDPQHRSDMAKLLDDRKRRRALPIWWFAGIVGVVAVSFLLFTMLRPATPVAQDAPGNILQKNTPADLRSSDTNSNAASYTEEVDNQDLKRDEPQSKSLPVQSSVSVISNSGITPDPGNEVDARRTNKVQSDKVQSNRAQSASAQPKIVVREALERPDMTQAKPTELIRELPAMDTQNENVGVASALIDGGGNEGPMPESAQSSKKQSATVTAILDPLHMEGIVWQDAQGVGPIEPRFIQRKPLYLLGELGGGWVFGSQPEYAPGWKARVGAGLGYDLSSKINLLWTAGYMVQEKGFDFERSSSVQQAGFGARSSFNTLTPERLHHVYSRLCMHYRIRRHLLHTYVGAQWLYGAQGRISIQVEDQFSGSNETSSYAWLNTDGLKRLRWTSGLAYGYQLTPRLMLLAGTEIQLSALTIDNAALAEEGYYWKGDLATFHPFVHLNYTLYGKR